MNKRARMIANALASDQSSCGRCSQTVQMQVGSIWVHDNTLVGSDRYLALSEIPTVRCPLCDWHASIHGGGSAGLIVREI